MRKTVDYGRVPQEVMMTGWNEEFVRAGTSYATGLPMSLDFEDENLLEEAKPTEDTYENRGELDAFRKTIHHARNLEVRGQYQEAARAFRNASHAQRIQSLAQEREELIQYRSTDGGYKDYLKQRYILEFGSAAEKEKAKIAIKELAKNSRLKPFVAYTMATQNKGMTMKSRADAYLEVANQFPTSKRVESALIMAGRCYTENDPSESEVKLAQDIFHRLLTEHPNSRFRANVEGWLGGIELRQDHKAEAISHFIRQSRSSIPRESWKGHQALAEIAQKDGRPADATVHWLYQRGLDVDLHFKYEASRQIRNIFGDLTAKDARVIQAKIRKDERLLNSYLDFRVEDTSLKPADERNLLSYVTSSLSSLKRVDKGLYARIAQLDYNSGRYARALKSARKARSTKGDIGNRAKYVEAASLARLGRRSEAISKYESLYRSNPPKHLRQGCAEALALLQEDAGNYGRAFELYHDIQYRSDAAFLADSVMSPTQLARQVRSQKHGDFQNALNYTLAMRYFRKGDYEKARRILVRMPEDLRKRKGLNYQDFQRYLSFSYFEKLPPKEVDPLDDVLKLQRLRRQAEGAKTQSGRAKAIYAMAQFTHSRRNLMFYSAGLWHGDRADVFGLYWNERINKGRSEEFAMKGAVEHECDAQTMRFCEELVKRCPRSPLVTKALYTAGVSAESLGRFNSWWSRRRTPMVKKSIGFFKKLYKNYPHDPLAKDARKFAEEFGEELKPAY